MQYPLKEFDLLYFNTSSGPCQSIRSKVLARDPSTRLLDGQFQKWTGKKILNPFKRRGLFRQFLKKNHGVVLVVYSEYVAMHRSIAKIQCFLNIETAGCQNLLPSNAPKYTVE